MSKATTLFPVVRFALLLFLLNPNVLALYLRTLIQERKKERKREGGRKSKSKKEP